MVKSYLGKKSTARALRLGRLAGVPHLVFMTDESRAPNPVDICFSLPAGSIVILRDYDHRDRLGLAEELRDVTTQCSQLFLVAGDAGLAHHVGADGLHLPEYQLSAPPSLSSFGLISAACHSRQSLLMAARHGVDFALVSPVFQTASHEGEAALGVHRFARMVRNAPVPVVALGGVNARNASLLKPFMLTGVAAIGVFSEGAESLDIEER